MKRRTLLAALVPAAAGIAGCQSLGAEDEESPPGARRTTFGVPPTETSTTDGTTAEGYDPPTGTTDRDTPVVRPPEAVRQGQDLSPPGDLTRAVETQVGPPRRMVLANRPLGGVPSGFQLVAGFLGTATRQSPARLWIGVQNATDADRVVEFGPTPPLSTYRGDPGDPVGTSTDPPPHLVLVPGTESLYPVSEVVPDRPTDGCWAVTGTPAGRAPPAEPGATLLEPGEAIAGEYLVLSATPDGCLPERERYQFGDGSGVGLLVSVWSPRTAAPASSRFDRSVPSLPGEDRTRWFHEATPDTTVYLEPSAERVELPAARVEFSLRNFSATTLSINPAEWVLYKFHGGEFKRVGPWAFSLPLTFVGPGDEHAIELGIEKRPGDLSGSSADDAEERSGASADDSDERSGASAVNRMAGIGPGLYAVQHGTSGVDPGTDGPLVVGLESGSETVERPQAVYAALLRVVGDALELTPTRDVERTKREGDRLTVYVDVGAERDPDTLVVRRVGPGTDPEAELITEQVFQAPALRNALAYLRADPDRSTVHVHTSEYAVRTPLRRFGPDDGTDRLRFRFDGEPFVAMPEAEQFGAGDRTTGG